MALVVVPIFYSVFQLLNSPEIASKISGLVFPVPLESCWPNNVHDPSPMDLALQVQEDGPILGMVASAIPHAMRIYCLVMIVVFPAIRMGFLFGTVIVPIALTTIGTRLNKLSNCSIVLMLLGAFVLSIGIPLMLIVLSIAFQGNLQLICP